MTYTIKQAGEQRKVRLTEALALGDILSDDEYDRVEARTLAAFSEIGAHMSLESLLHENQVVTLRPTEETTR